MLLEAFLFPRYDFICRLPRLGWRRSMMDHYLAEKINLWTTNISAAKKLQAILSTRHQNRSAHLRYQTRNPSKLMEEIAQLSEQTSLLTCAVACRGLVIPGATAWLDAPLLNSSIEQ